VDLICLDFGALYYDDDDFFITTFMDSNFADLFGLFIDLFGLWGLTL